MKSKLLSLIKIVAPAIGGGGVFLALGTDLLTGLGLPIWAVKFVAVLLGLGGLGPWLNWLLKNFLTTDRLRRWEKWAGDKIDIGGEGIGIVITAGMSRIESVGDLWNSTFEPWLIVILKTVASPLSRLIPAIIRGLTSDNDPDQPNRIGQF